MASDRFKYFRIEAGELLEGISRGLVAIEAGGSPAQVDRLLRLTHTLKGAARVVGLADIASGAHAIEERLTPFRTGGALPDRPAIDACLAALDAIGGAVAALQVPEAGRAPVEESFETVRIELAAMDGLLASLSAARMGLDGLRREAARQAGSWHTALAHTEEALEAAYDQAHAMRLLPVQRVFAQLGRSARDAAESQGKRVELVTRGGDTRMDGHVLLGLRDALIHLVRNAVAHGLEPEHERRAAGKPPVGRVTLTVERHGAHVTITCHDDGRGIAPDRLREAAVRLGRLTAREAAALDDDAARALLFTSGFTTADVVSELAGRGVGLDAVKSSLEGLKGSIRLASEPGAGTTVEMVVPMSLASLSALVVEAASCRLALPLDAVKGAFRLEEAAIARVDGRETVMFEGEAIPYVPLERSLAIAARRRQPIETAVAVTSQGATAAIGVDRLAGTRELVVRALPAVLGPQPLVAGAALEADGTPLPVLEPAGLVASASKPAPEPVASATPLPILVIDDSLTTRMLEQSILESAGYAVAVATSGEEAIEMAVAGSYGLFVVDVEMPGMSGFDFVERTRRDPRLQHVPAIMVTSRDSEADRRRGAEAGASAYMVKSAFDQGAFVALVRGLVAAR